MNTTDSNMGVQQPQTPTQSPSTPADKPAGTQPEPGKAYPHMHEGMSEPHSHGHVHEGDDVDESSKSLPPFMHPDDKKAEEAAAKPPDPEDKKELAEKPTDKPDAEDKKEKPKESKARTMYLSELVNMSESSVDRKNGTIAVTLIKKGWSDNGRYYGEKVIQDSMGIWEGARAFGDHPSKSGEEDLPERSIWDQMGYYSDPTYKDGAVKATLKLVGDENKKSHILDWAEESIKTGKALMGISINALGKTKIGEAEGRKGVIVSELAVGNSADIVTRPAAGGSFDAVLASNDEFTTNLLKHMDYEEWRESRPEFEARLLKEWRTARKEEINESQLTSINEKDSKIEELTETVKRTGEELVQKVGEYESRINAMLVDQKLAESGLPEEWKEPLKSQLNGKTAEEMDTLVATEKAKYFAISEPVIPDSPNGEVTREAAYALKASPVSNHLRTEADLVPMPNENFRDWNKRTGKK